jgi:hypothetical protein
VKAAITSRPDDSWLDMTFFENQEKFPPEALLPYAGRYIAWSWDGSRILDSAEEEEQLWDKLVAAGENPHRVVFDYVDIV